MCFQHNKREITKKFPSIIEEQVYVVQLNVVALRFILCIAFSILVFLYNNRVLLDTLFICEKC